MKGLKRSLDRGNPLEQHVIKETIVLDDFVINVTENTTGFGTAVLDSFFSKGNVLLLGATFYADLSTVPGNIIAAWEGDISLGTTGISAAGALTGGLANIIPSSAVGPANIGVFANARVVSDGDIFGGTVNNTDEDKNVNLNIILDASSISADGDIAVSNARVTIAYLLLGDDDL